MAFSDFAISVTKGDTAFLDFAVTTNQLPQDITGWTIWLTAKRRAGDADLAAVLQKSTTGGGITISSPTGGIGFVTLNPADTAALPEEPLTLLADLQGKDGAAHIFTLSRGKITVLAEATAAS